MSVLVGSFDVFVAHVRLDDPAFFAPFAPDIDLLAGRPSTPSEWYLRLMFPKFGYRLGFEPMRRRQRLDYMPAVLSYHPRRPGHPQAHRRASLPSRQRGRRWRGRWCSGRRRQG